MTTSVEHSSSPLQAPLDAKEVEHLHAICDRQSVYELKLLLKRDSLFNPKRPLIITSSDEIAATDSQTRIAKIPTKFTRLNPSLVEKTEIVLPIDHPSITIPSTFIESASGLLKGFQWISCSSYNNHHEQVQRSSKKYQSASPLIRVIESFLGHQADKDMIAELPKWELYDQFLLFQSNAFQTSSSSNKLSRLLEGDRRAEFFAAVASEFKVTHVARKGLIDRNDVSRQPRLEPLHGIFDHKLSKDGQPSSFDQVFWTSTKFPTPQGVLKYVWAPSQTMYSRGNSPEKRRIACLDNVAGSIVVDMCCGIGFFAFGYLLAGAAKVIGCEISPWAVEGLRRGAILNKIPYEIIEPGNLTTDLLDTTSSRLLIFPGRNELALPIYRNRATHVNLGLLPSSVEFLPQAVDALLPEGGWLHIHGELAVGGGPSGRLDGAQIWATQLVDHVLRLGRQSATVIGIHWIKSIGPAKEHLVVELQVGAQQSH
ncbi:hypothetical protein MJO29_012934 [Puccinia striiformis f. sp. tritici]|uniref:tRNA(Phe) (4-demethylwyosine(37)-C(7)) aminocarboxypropyltransferase n=3 Tax=Puccinia striiformis TaxID=27350 RepID=A0A0L0V3W7_9BASI|nr:hypothetical protein Pst134EA_024377 [Puccinia striiformis f. sp. tritici]KNE93896.1 hypothetical protein PSTG_12699 [Puccinia striiformis f. sp. tritici PST-78]POW16944.1 hypothetical protein PSHT_06557 [Puccinia striiformis]KAH9444809.1 hypothetical protein Pst134EB_025066 [Puccinia striiformis f. sp. tritici]KAH9453510.1 hypothetical protein Pst134EA_024377 [Puccinia striiformis f. sp. tritici]KAI7943090.1 hypothetical protein MJO29_012934 [Puccinia striiformis f. sp. tritici]